MNPAVTEQKMRATWHTAKVSSPHLANPVDVIEARDVPYVKDNNRLQNLNVYLPNASDTRALLGTTLRPPHRERARWLVYVHGGAWRDPFVLSNSIEATVAQTFGGSRDTISAVASVNYSLSPYPSHPTHPYDPSKGDQNDAAREFSHPRHVLDVVAALDFLRDVLGMRDDGYVLVGHSCGATLALQATLMKPSVWSQRESFATPPRPAAVLGLNGLYDLPLLVHEPSTHADIRDVYESFLRQAFGERELDWKMASPACFDPDVLTERVKEGSAPTSVIIDQSREDQLVPLNQTEAMERLLNHVPQISVTRGQRMTGRHNDAWESGVMILDAVEQIVQRLDESAK